MVSSLRGELTRVARAEASTATLLLSLLPLLPPLLLLPPAGRVLLGGIGGRDVPSDQCCVAELAWVLFLTGIGGAAASPSVPMLALSTACAASMRSRCS